ncbi:VOC family protein [Aquimarina sp. ERC-38]|uniref:VOC family protein n=1 Tax=Aquimarina sp. ERC-38 TaxID=2949996 RepID=UPI0022475DBB|nr:VOC family protein [Aquimarina sp. ERC-38]UZO82661.1 VOC family protein [Aquimarina sp. ERC-38]
MNEFEEKIGVRPIFGGYHKTQGTKNALVNLDNGCYLEIIAIDDTNADVNPPRWMGVDMLSKDQITRFAIKSNSLQKDADILNKWNDRMGTIARGSRNTAEGTFLQWELLMPLATPEVELIPFMIDWSKSEIHPSEFLPNMGCQLIELYGTHPDPRKFDELFKDLNYDFRIKKATEVAIKLVLQTPNGKVEL